MQDFPTLRRLHARGPMSRGLIVDAEGVSLGPDCVLVRWTRMGYRVVNPVEVDAILRYAFRDRDDFSELNPRLGRIASALEAGDLAKAQILGLQLPFDELDEEELRRLEHGTRLVKTGYDPNQPRDENGRWTSGGAGALAVSSAPSRSPSQALLPPSAAFASSQTGVTAESNLPMTSRLLEAPAEFTAEEAAEAAEPIWNTISRMAPEVLEGIIADLAAPLAVADALFVPSNKSNIHGGDVPGLPGISYRSDEGVLSFERLDPDGSVHQFGFLFPDGDGFYRDSQGDVVGRRVGTGFAFDTNTIASMIDAGPKPAQQRDQQPSTEDDARPSPVLPQTDDEPRICPPPSPERIKGRSERALAYQEQITGLPRGFDVVFGGERFDGCDEKTGHLLEAKGPGLEWPLDVMDKKWWRSSWNGYFEIMGQAYRQNNASGDRIVEWHFAEKGVADFFREEFKRAGYSSIDVKWTSAIVLKVFDRFNFVSLIGKLFLLNGPGLSSLTRGAIR